MDKNGMITLDNYAARKTQSAKAQLEASAASLKTGYAEQFAALNNN